MHLPTAALLCALPLCAQGFVDVTLSAGLGAVPRATAFYGSGACAFDYDRDGDQDLVVAGPLGAPLQLFRNDGGMVFTDRSAASGLGVCDTVHALIAGDIDNDGDLDLFVGNWRTPPDLFLNNGNGTFTEQAAARGITSSTSVFSANFGDYDRDGWLDLYVGNRGIGEPNQLYRNLGNGQFQEVAAVVGCADIGMTLCSAFVDYDEDGWPDILVGNDKGPLWRPNELYRNLGDGTFAARGAQVGANAAIDSMGIDFADAFADGGVDWFQTDRAPDHLFQVWDPALLRYQNRQAVLGMQGGFDGWAMNFLDCDNDGWVDLHVVHEQGPNHLYRNPGQPFAANAPWPEIGASVGINANFTQYTALRADFDNDGGVDILDRFDISGAITQAPRGLALRRNQLPRGNWISFALQGTRSNRDGIGACVKVHGPQGVQRQWVRTGSGFLSSSDLRMHFGLGARTTADFVEILWPSGQVQYLTGLAANQIVPVREPDLQLAAPARVGQSTALDLQIDSDHGLVYVMALAFFEAPGVPLSLGRTLPMYVDQLTVLSTAPGNAVLPGCIGILDAQGRASSPLHIPPLPLLAGLPIFATGITLDPARFVDVRTIFPRALRIVIQ